MKPNTGSLQRSVKLTNICREKTNIPHQESKRGSSLQTLQRKKVTRKRMSNFTTADPAAPRRRINSWGDTNYRNSLKK